MEKKRILCVWELTDEEKEMLEAACPSGEFVYLPTARVSDEELAEANVILGNIPEPRLAVAKKLEWMQLQSAGSDGYCVPGILPEETVLTNGSGAYGMPIAEHMLGEVLMLKKKLGQYYDNQKQHQWKDEGMVSGIWNSTTLVLGTGNLGGEFAWRMKALGSHVIGLRRRMLEKPDYLDEQYLLEELDQVLPRADIVAVCLPGTKTLTEVIGEKELSLMKKTAILVNVGRGSLVNSEALERALRNGQIAGAAVDVTEPEPLPEDHPLWNAPNLLITPHISGGTHMKEIFETILEITKSNLKAYSQGQPLRNVVDRSQGY